MSTKRRRGVGDEAAPAERRVHDIMSWPAVATGPLVWADVAARYAEERGVRRLFVRSSNGKLGVVRREVLRRAPVDALVLDCPIDDVLELEPQMTLDEASRRLDESGEECAICSWKGQVGMVTRGDLRRARQDAAPSSHSGVHDLRDALDEDLELAYYRDVGGGD
ncbi:MAG: CBS domain-containing protein [Polyangiaceae bacterium]|nr:CBS domain-containing protein [Polyangiaceae bacterium]